MIKQIFVNLPIKDLPKTMAFWQALGFSFNPQFTNDQAGALQLGDNIFAMLLTEPFFKTFTNKTIADSNTTVEVLNAVSVESREAVDQLMEKALANGGTEPRPLQDYGWMYARSFNDVDGHGWEVTFMDLSKVPANPAQQ